MTNNAQPFENISARLEARGDASAEFPFFAESVTASVPSPAAGEFNGTLDLNELCVRHPAATYFIRARGESMLGAGIGDGDVLVVDRSATAANGDIIIAAVDGEFTVKRLSKRGNEILLLPENPAFFPIRITCGMNAEYFGVVTHVVKTLRSGTAIPPEKVAYRGKDRVTHPVSTRDVRHAPLDSRERNS